MVVVHRTIGPGGRHILMHGAYRLSGCMIATAAGEREGGIDSAVSHPLARRTKIKVILVFQKEITFNFDQIYLTKY
jgi:hypothetical protein